jgi:hypothetical protein
VNSLQCLVIRMSHVLSVLIIYTTVYNSWLLVDKEVSFIGRIIRFSNCVCSI